MARYSLLALILLAGCGTPTTAVKITCLPLVEYDKNQQLQLANEWARLDPHSLTASRFIPDAIKMRDADRACIADHG